MSKYPCSCVKRWKGCSLMSSLFLLLAKIFCRREVQIMAVVYATLIVKGLKTLEQVPKLLRQQVSDILAALEVNEE